MTNIGKWLAGLGLGQYADAFAAHDVDASLLADLTDADLETLGVASLGHRKRMLKAIAELAVRDDAGAAAAPPSVAAGRTDSTADAQRRVVTVMFCDLVGSTALSTRLDPEDLRDVIARYHRLVSAVVTRLDGFPAQFMGDGVMAFFGYPQAHEDDAERAVRAGLAVIDEVVQLQPSGEAPLAVRVGIATGPVVVGELGAPGTAQDNAAIGQTPNLAARLQALAAPGTVAISAATRLAVAGVFEYRDLGTHAVKGFDEPQPAWQVLGLSAAQGRFEAYHGAELAPMVGRDEELAIVLRRWSRAENGEGQVVLLCAEAGVGKSRLVAALEQALRSRRHAGLRWFGSPYHTESPLHPFIAQLGAQAGITPADDAGSRIAAIERVLGGDASARDDLPLLCDLLLIPTAGRYASFAGTPQQKKARSLQALLHRLEREAGAAPVLAVFEDAHWADPTSLELLDLLVESVAQLPVLLVLTHRPEFAAPWTGRAHVTTLTLSRLGRREGVQIAQRVAGGRTLPPDLLAEILERTDGVPLYLEEFTSAVLDSGVVRERDGRLELTGPLSSLAVPATLQASLVARLDRMAPVRAVAQIGAAIGREFGRDLLAEVAQLPERQLDDALAQLVNAGLVFHRAGAGAPAFQFKHALVQDAVYGTLLRSRRQQLHGLIASALAEKLPDIAMSQPEVLARHLAESGRVAEAIDQWERAGGLAAARSAFVEAVLYWTRAADAARKLAAEGTDRDAWERRELGLLMRAGSLTMMTKGTGSAEARHLYERACVLSDRVGTDEQRFVSVFDLWFNAEAQLRLDDAGRLIERAVSLAEHSGDDRFMVQARHASFTTGVVTGHFERTVADAADAYRRYRPVDGPYHRETFAGHDPIYCAIGVQAIAELSLGRTRRAYELLEELESRLPQADHLPTLLIAKYTLANAYVVAREPRRLRAIAADSAALCRRLSLRQYEGAFNVAAVWADAMLDGAGTDLAQLAAGIEMFESTGTRFRASFLRAAAADACLAAGDLDAGLAFIERALSELVANGELGYHAWALIVRASLHAAAGRAAAAEADYGAAIEVAQRQRARGIELRAATGLARLLRARGDVEAPRELLVSLLASFPPGFSTSDLDDARALLAA